MPPTPLTSDSPLIRVQENWGRLTANTMQVAGGGDTFTLQTKPTPLQQRCFELLGVTPRM